MIAPLQQIWKSANYTARGKLAITCHRKLAAILLILTEQHIDVDTYRGQNLGVFFYAA